MLRVITKGQSAPRANCSAMLGLPRFRLGGCVMGGGAAGLRWEINPCFKVLVCERVRLPIRTVAGPRPL